MRPGAPPSGAQSKADRPSVVVAAPIATATSPVGGWPSTADPLTVTVRTPLPNVEWPTDRTVVVDASRPSTASASVLVASWGAGDAPSVTRTTTSNAPTAVGVPESTPAGDSASPGGSP